MSGWPGGDLLSRALRHSTMGAGGFHGRVRNGIGCWDPRYEHQVVQPDWLRDRSHEAILQGMAYQIGEFARLLEI